MPNQIQFENPRESRCSMCRAKLLYLAIFFILIVCVPRDAVSALAPVITSATSASVTVGSVFSYQITGTNAPSSYRATGLPAGLAVNTGTGWISGTPTAAGTWNVTPSASNSGGTGSATLTLTILPSSSFVQAVANKALVTTNSLSLSFPSSTLAGDVILVGFDYNKISTPLSVTDSQGNTFTQVGSQLTSPGGSRSVVYLARNIKGGADTLTVNLTANSAWLELYLTEYSGVNQTNPIDAQAGASGNSGPVSSGNATTSVAGDIIYGYCVGDWACTAGSGFTARSTLDDNLSESKIAGNPGPYAATGSATSGWTMQMVALKPAAPATSAVVSLSPSSLTFSGQGVGATSASQSITLNNSGSAALSITSIAVTGTNGSDFAQTNTCGSSVAAGTTCTLGVTFKPTATGTRTAAVTLTDNATGSPQSVSLSGTGAGTVGGAAGAVASLSYSSLNFGNEPVSVISSSQIVTLTNTGSAALSIASIAFTGANAADFTQVNTCGASTAAGASCTIAILFTPSAIGARGTSLVITDNASGSPQSVSLSGTGVHDVVLTWTANGTSGATGYNVYRGTTSGGESSTTLNSAPINGTTYADTNVTAGASYYYVVKAVGLDGVTQSASSNEASATVPSP